MIESTSVAAAASRPMPGPIDGRRLRLWPRPAGREARRLDAGRVAGRHLVGHGYFSGLGSLPFAMLLRLEAQNARDQLDDQRPSLEQSEECTAAAAAAVYEKPTDELRRTKLQGAELHFGGAHLVWEMEKKFGD